MTVPPRRPLQLSWIARWVLIGFALSLSGCTTIEGWFGGSPAQDTGPAVDPCEEDPFGADNDGIDCPCVTDPTQDFCPDPCTEDPTSSLCVQDAGGSDAGETDAQPDAKPDGKADIKKDGGKDGADADTKVSDADAAADDSGDGALGPDAVDSGDAESLPDLVLLPDGNVVQEDGATFEGDLPDGWLEAQDGKDAKGEGLSDGSDGDASGTGDGADIADSIVDIAADVPDIGPDATWPLPDGAEVQEDGAVLLADGNVVPKTDLPACLDDKDCIGPAKTCLNLKCLVDKTVPGGRACGYIVQSYGALCTDGNACTGNDKCDGKGVCQGLSLICEDKDDNPCTQPVCDPVKGCEIVYAPNSPPVVCTDGNLCTAEETCQGGKCTATSGKNKCECFAKADCAKHEDGNLCNGTLTCKSGVCVTDASTVVWFDAGKSKVCDDAKDTACNVNLCTAKTGKCEMTAKQFGTACSDDDACSGQDMCLNGACKGAAVVDCDDKNKCTTDSCDAIKGCLHAPNALLCDDGDPCTDNDACQTGECLGTPKGLCECLTDADCSKFDDKNKCNGWLTCQNFQCAIDPKTIVTCPPGGSCNPQSCDAASGSCVADNLSAGVPCNDNSQCTLGDNCDGKGYCNPGVQIGCDDKNPCTADECMPAAGCIHKYSNGLGCSDGDPCTVGDLCLQGKCTPGENKCDCETTDDCLSKVAPFDKCAGDWKCADVQGLGQCIYSSASAVACKADSAGPCAQVACDSLTGSCKTTNLENGTACNDGTFCTVLDRCQGGQCAGDKNPCDDGLPCTADSCDEKITSGDACKHEKLLLEGLPCSDGSACTSDDLCSGGYCVGKAIACDDKNICTVDACDKAIGCTHAPAIAGVSCDDANACTGDPGNNDAKFKQDRCDGSGSCLPGDPKVCSSSNSCVEIPCNSTATTLPSGGGKLGCEQKILLNNKPCNDGDSCTMGEYCQVGQCTAGTPTSCDDQNDCTKDGCDKLKGCGHNPVGVPCDDKDPCTDKDTCLGGACFGTLANCDDENICTLDACDPALGCTHKAGVGDCGDFAQCSTDAAPKCVFKGGLHLVISEIYIGDPANPADDWVEVHNPTDGTAKLGDYVLEARPFDADPKDEWTVLATGKSGVSLPPHRYVLIGNSQVAQNGVAADLVDSALKLGMALKAMPGKAGCTVDSLRHLQLRLRDVPHQLEHDRVYWSDGQPAGVPPGVAPIDAAADYWPSWSSAERHATEYSDAGSMSPHRPEWLAGNAWDTGKDDADFLMRNWPDPQNLSGGKYEPSCGGTCAAGKICTYDPMSEKCVDDLECKSFGVTGEIGCGPGKICGPGMMTCIPEPTGSVLISEIYFGPDGEQYVELYNSGTKPVPMGGWRLQKRDADVESFKPWVSTVAVIPAGTVLAAKRYYLIGSQAWARVHGQVDLVPVVPSLMQIAGGAVRLWDPASDTEMDMLGWGSALTYSNVGVSGQYKAATPVIAPGYSLERKAKLGSTQGSMKPAGGEDLAGNGQDANNDSLDFITADPTPQTMGSGAYEPSCGSTCPQGLVCNYLGGAQELCVDPLCGIPCDLGYGCNPKTSKCDLKLLVAEVAAEGPQTTSQKGSGMFSADNEYVVLYNPSPSTIQLAKTEIQGGKPVIIAAMVLQMQGQNDSTMTSITDSSITGKPMSGTVAPFSYYLVAPTSYDKDLPAPDFIATKSFNLPSAAGLLRLVSTNNVEYDRIVWGSGMNNKAEGTKAAEPQVSQTCGDGQAGALRRRSLVSAPAGDLGSASKAAFYLGAGLDTNLNSADWVRIPKRTPRSQKCSWPSDGGSTAPFCVGYPVGQRP